MICTFISRINDVAPGIIYELHEGETNYYLIKWKINGRIYETKEKKKTVDWWFRKGKLVKQ